MTNSSDSGRKKQLKMQKLQVPTALVAVSHSLVGVLITTLAVSLLLMSGQMCQVAAAAAGSQTTALTTTTTGSKAAINGERIFESLKGVDNCIVESVYSFIYPSSYPPSSLDTMRQSCRRQAEGIKCVREQSKGTSPLLRRGLTAFAQNRQRFHRKYCSNVDGEQAKKFYQAMKCVMEKKFSHYVNIDSDFANSALEIYKRNYDDAAVELKYLCCSIINYRRSIIEGAGAECQASKPILEEMILSIVANEISLICEDEEKLVSKVCPQLPPMNLPKSFNTTAPGTIGPSSTILYLVATLGEPESREPSSAFERAKAKAASSSTAAATSGSS